MTNIILYEPEIPNNTGNIIRIAKATGAKLHIIKPLGFELHPKWFKRAAAGRVLSDIEHEVYENYKAFEKKYGDKKIYYITRYGMKTYTEVKFKKEEDVWVMFGKESTGVPKEILQRNIERCLRIPMVPGTRSLNLANTVMLMSYEIARQQDFPGMSKFEVQKGKDFLLKKNV